MSEPDPALQAALSEAVTAALAATTDLDAKEEAKKAAIEAAGQAATVHTDAESKLDASYKALREAIKRTVVILFLLMPATALAISTPAPILTEAQHGKYERRPVQGILQRADAAWVGFWTGLLGPKPNRVANP
jgi:hypothetical protein